MKKKVFRERYINKEIKELIDDLKPAMKLIVESKKYAKPRLAKELKKKSGK